MPADAEPAGSGGGRRLRVLVAIKGLAHGGAERLLVDTLAARDTTAFDYEVAYLMAGADALAPAIEDLGVPVHGLGATANVDLRWVPRFRRLLRDGRFDVVHFHLPYTAALGRLAVLSLPGRSRPATVYTEHSLWNKVSPPVKALNRTTVTRDAALLAVSPAAYDALPRGLRGRARVVVHGIDQTGPRAALDRRGELRGRVRRELEVPDGALLCVTVAGLRAEQGYDVLLDAAAEARRRGLPLRFAAAGDGALADELQARRTALGLGDEFRFLGHRPDALELVTAADVFVLPSRQEGLPVVLMEATSVGTPIVASAVGGVPQVLDDGETGLLVPPGEPTALVDALERLAADPALRARLADGALGLRDEFDAARAAADIEREYVRIGLG
ncbi:MAG: glycosyltransferase [Acidimicrobiales bacterium]|nr:glycosyltransferase [Acidimicrobiales bacterium]